MALFISIPSTVDFSFVHSDVQQSLLLHVATFEIDFFFFVPSGCGYVRSNHSSGLPYDKITITIVERDTKETSLVHCLIGVGIVTHTMVIYYNYIL